MPSSQARKKSGVLIWSGPPNSQELSLIAPKSGSSDHPNCPFYPEFIEGIAILQGQLCNDAACLQQESGSHQNREISCRAPPVLRWLPSGDIALKLLCNSHTAQLCYLTDSVVTLLK